MRRCHDPERQRQRYDAARARPRSLPNPDKAGEEGAAFWRFSLALYARPGVADTLIALQDRVGLDVNLILFGLWIGARHGCELGAEGFAAAAFAIAELNGAVRSIRALRRQLRDATDSDIRHLRRALLSVELAAERQVQKRLAALFATEILPHRPGDRHAAALANLARCLGDESDSPEAAVLRQALAGLTRRS
jgi:uncharacterized protein (TIGR02444 family)